MKHHVVLSRVFVLLMAVVVAAEDFYDNGNSNKGEPCQHENFYCHRDNPSIFYRCINRVLHAFNCPSGLHFSVTTQTCDWPHLADCSKPEAQADATSSKIITSNNNNKNNNNKQAEGDDLEGDGDESPRSRAQPSASAASRDQDSAKGLGDAAELSWISQAASSGKSWWRPEGVNPSQWKDVHAVRQPAFLPHVPDPPSPNSDKTPKRSEDMKKSSTSASKKSGSDISQLPPIDRAESFEVQWKEGPCSSTCQLPDCYCAGTAIPNGLPATSVPQMVMITFDDEVSPAFYGYYQRLFRPGRYNPNGCPVRGCLYVSGSGTKYELVYPLYAMGIEIASHTISHRFPHTWWSTATYKEYMDEAGGMRDNLVIRSGIPKEAIKGFRVPFLQLGGDNMYSALYDSKFVYDTSMFTGSQWEGGEPVWPFTLDYVPEEQFCQHGLCPTKQYPGMWEIPVQRWYGLDGHSCAMPDGCSSTVDAEETLEYLKSNFRRFYDSNRAPFGIFVHARWFNSAHNLDGLDRFIDYLLTLDDVFFVTPSQVIEWIKKPTPLSEINGFGPWSCQGGAKDVSGKQAK